MRGAPLKTDLQAFSGCGMPVGARMIRGMGALVVPTMGCIIFRVDRATLPCMLTLTISDLCVQLLRCWGQIYPWVEFYNDQNMSIF